MKRLIVTTLFSLSVLSSNAVLAQGNQLGPGAGFYLGAGIGYTTVDSDAIDYLKSRGANTDDSDTAYKLFAGYDFNDKFSLEASYIDFGEASANGSVGSDSVDIEASLDGIGFAALARWPIPSGVGIYAKLGLVAWDSDVKGHAIDDGVEYYFIGVDGTDPFYGVGAEFVVDRVMIRGEYERYDISNDGEDFTIDLASLSLGYLF
ncbi:porin family protein [Onishia taeanensis]